MKNRFSSEKKASSFRNLLLSFGIFAIIFLAFLFGFSSVSEKAKAEEQKTLENAIVRGAIYCYAIEGRYPESLDYLKENYGLFYDEDKYLVDYQPFGSNIMPDITVIRKRADKEAFH